MNKVFNDDEVELYFKIHDAIQERIYEIVDVKGSIDNKWYSVQGYGVFNGEIYASVEHGYSGYECYSSIHISRELLTDDDVFNELKKEAESAKGERKLKEELKEKEKIEQKLKEAEEFIAKYGGINNEK